MKNNRLLGIFVGQTVQDTMIHVSSIPTTSGAKGKWDKRLIVGGGFAANAAVAFGHMGKLGGWSPNKTYWSYAALCTQFGATNSHLVRPDIQGNGVCILDVAPDKYELAENFIRVSTGKGVLSHEREDRFSAPFENPCLHGEVKDQAEALMPEAHIVVLGNRYPELGLPVAQLAREHGVPVVLDARRWRNYTPALIEVADMIVTSPHFKPNGQRRSAQDLIQYFQEEWGKQKVAVTRGNKNVKAKDGEHPEFEVEFPAVDIVDITGARDMLVGFFAYFYTTSEGNFTWALTKATQLAAQTATHFGTRAALEDIEPVVYTHEDARAHGPR